MGPVTGGCFNVIQPRDSGHARAPAFGRDVANADADADAVAGGAVQGEEKDMVRPLFRASPPPARPARVLPACAAARFSRDGLVGAPAFRLLPSSPPPAALDRRGRPR